MEITRKGHAILNQDQSSTISVYLGRHWHYACDLPGLLHPMYLQLLVIKNWSWWRPRNEAILYDLSH